MIKRFKLLVLLCLVVVSLLTLSSCSTVYSLTSGATWAVTGKTVSDHLASELMDQDCRTDNLVDKLDYCKQDRGRTYTRSGL